MTLIQTRLSFPDRMDYVPYLDECFSIFPILKKINFESWWNETVILDKNKSKFSRKLLVLSLSNKDGGAHVDHTLDEQYANLSRFNSLNWVLITSEHEIKGPSTGPEIASVRQIAYEVLLTLKDEFPDLFIQLGHERQ